jgi:hypothetical protein
MLNFFALGIIPGFLCPLAVWLVRICRGGEMSGDFWLGIASSYLVAIVLAIGLMLLLHEGVERGTAEQDLRQRQHAEDIKTFRANHNDPVFGVPLRHDGFEALEIAAGSQGEGSYCKVNPKDPPVPAMSTVSVFHHTDGFRERQRELYLKVINDFDSIWRVLYLDVNRAHQETWDTDDDIPRTTENECDLPLSVTWFGLKIGKDNPGLPLSYMVSVEYGQDEYVDVWVLGEKVTKTEFYM